MECQKDKNYKPLKLSWNVKWLPLIFLAGAISGAITLGTIDGAVKGWNYKVFEKIESVKKRIVEKYEIRERKYKLIEPNGLEIRLENVEDLEEPNNLEILTNSNNPERISDKGIKLIKELEGFAPIVYDDAGNLAIGYGHQIKKNEKLNYITEEYAGKLLIEDLALVEKAINDYVVVPLNQNQYDTLCSFIYNVGIGNFRQSTLLKKLNNKDYEGASEEFERWNKSKRKVSEGLKIRRQKEYKLFLSDK